MSVVGSSANSNYNSLQVYLERRFSTWYGFTAAYTWSKSIDDVSDALNVLATDVSAQQDPRNNRNNRAVSAFDVPHRFVLTNDFTSNFKGIGNRWLRQAANGWELGGIFQAQSGLPQDLFAGTVAGIADGTLFGGNGAQRPNQVGPVNLKFQPNPGGGANNPNLIANSGLAQPVDRSDRHFGTKRRTVESADRVGFDTRPHVQIEAGTDEPQTAGTGLQRVQQHDVQLGGHQPLVSIDLRILLGH